MDINPARYYKCRFAGAIEIIEKLSDSASQILLGMNEKVVFNQRMPFEVSFCEMQVKYAKNAEN